MFKEIQKIIYKKLEDSWNYSESEILYPIENKEPTEGSWVIPHILNFSYFPDRKANEISGNVQFSIFSTSRNNYKLSEILEELLNIFQNKTIGDSVNVVKFDLGVVVYFPTSEDIRLKRTLQHATLTFSIVIGTC